MSAGGRIGICAGSRIGDPDGGRRRLQLCLPARPDSIARLRRAVVEFANGHGASDRQRDDIALAVSEALSNAVLHAYVGHASPGIMRVKACMHEHWLEVVVSDQGVGMLPRADSPGLGIGLALIGRITERLELESRESIPGLRVRMTFAIT
jgi:anti-sigma regulatory factor (Ser/Thr protein kinase)